MSYATYTRLRGGQGALAHYETLEVLQAAQAEFAAAVYIDQQFRDYRRALWTPDTAPVEVQQIAQLVAEAEYIMLDFAGGSPGSAPPPMVQALRARADLLAEQARINGSLTNSDGSTVSPIQPTGFSGAVLR